MKKREEHLRRFLPIRVWLCVILALSISGYCQSGRKDSGTTEGAQGTEPVAETVARSAIAASLSKDLSKLHLLYEESLNLNDESPHQGKVPLYEAIGYLYISSLSDRESFLKAAEEGVRQTRSEEIRWRLLQALLDDDYYELNQLKGQDKFNKFTRVFNRASTSLSKLALFQPQDAAQLLLDSAYSIRKARSTTERERRMIYLCRRFLAEYPDAPEREEVQLLLDQLTNKLRRERVEQSIVAGQIALDAQDYRAAIFHLENAKLLDSSHTKALELLATAQKEAEEAEEARALSVSVAPWEDKLSPQEQKALEASVRALFCHDDAALSRLAAEVPSLADSILYARAALTEQKGSHDEACNLLADVAREFENRPGGRAAAALLATPSYNLDSAYDEAVQKFIEERKRFILTGKRSTEDNAYVLGSAALDNIGQNAVNIPALFFTDMLVRGVAEYFRTQVAIDGVIDAGAAYIRRYPGGTRAAEIAKEIAMLSQKSGDPARSRTYLEYSGPADASQTKKIRENEARELFESAQKSTDLVSKKRLLEHLLNSYPDTKIAKTASRELARIPPNLEPGSIVLPRKMLAKDPELLEALGLTPEVVDGNKRNGELSEEGIAIDGEGRRFSYKFSQSQEFEIKEVPREKRTWILARARALHTSFAYELKAKETLHHQIVPLQIEGGAGSGGVEVAPKLIPYPDLGETRSDVK